MPFNALSTSVWMEAHVALFNQARKLLEAEPVGDSHLVGGKLMMAAQYIENVFLMGDEGA